MSYGILLLMIRSRQAFMSQRCQYECTNELSVESGAHEENERGELLMSRTRAEIVL